MYGRRAWSLPYPYPYVLRCAVLSGEGTQGALHALLLGEMVKRRDVGRGGCGHRGSLT
jgi:hypothetical protein